MELSKKKKKSLTLESQLMYDLGTCSKSNDLSRALSLYDDAISNNLRLNHNHFNTLLYICSNSLTSSPNSTKASTIDKGFTIFDRMIAQGINPTEAAITAVARLAAAKGDGELAFELVKNMGKYKALPRLRTYGPALFAFCENLEAEKAYIVEEHMAEMKVGLEEAEVAALLRVSVETGRVDKVYAYLLKLRNCVGCVSDGTVKVLEDWFGSELAARAGVGAGAGALDLDRIRGAVVSNGVGGMGRAERLACVDIDNVETKAFAESVASLALKREAHSNFSQFQEWLKNHADYEAVVDGANVGLYQQNFADGGFSISQLNVVVKEIRQRCHGKWPLVVLHKKRYWSLMDDPSNRELLEEWSKQDVLYTTPNGSNDDWYWIYAAVKLKCLLVSNDEMRDHIFELLGRNFFLKWKERHQVHFIFCKGSLQLQMPPSYSVVMQESEKGSWHVPTADGCNDEASRTWLCISRPNSYQYPDENSMESIDPVVDSLHSSNQPSPSACGTETVIKENGSHGTTTSFQSFNYKPASKTGKRKERSPPHSSCHLQLL
ncbi:hypothetical protein Syun_016516 [Stephania yunnanensis]|uniref:Mitochondrial ribonuclease P catalytic subunit n=1 Tax=Stephania yunnanensis TaxID=152371 RepID=A0AAP0P2J1_9MAGN